MGLLSSFPSQGEAEGVGYSGIATTVDVAAVETWVVAFALLFGTGLRRGLLTGDTSVVSGEYFLAGPLLLSDLFGVTFSPIPDRMFLEKLRKN